MPRKVYKYGSHHYKNQKSKLVLALKRKKSCANLVFPLEVSITVCGTAKKKVFVQALYIQGVCSFGPT